MTAPWILRAGWASVPFGTAEKAVLFLMQGSRYALLRPRRKDHRMTESDDNRITPSGRPRLRTLIGAALASFVLALGATACGDDENASDEAGQEVEESANDAGSAAEGAAEDAGDAAGDAAEDAGDAAEDAGNAAEDAGDDAAGN